MMMNGLVTIRFDPIHNHNTIQQCDTIVVFLRYVHLLPREHFLKNVYLDTRCCCCYCFETIDQNHFVHSSLPDDPVRLRIGLTHTGLVTFRSHPSDIGILVVVVVGMVVIHCYCCGFGGSCYTFVVDEAIPYSDIWPYNIRMVPNQQSQF